MYEPLKLYSDKYLIWKNCFPVAPALAKRVSKLMAFSFESDILVPSLLYQNLWPSVSDLRFEEFIIPSFSDFADRD